MATDDEILETLKKLVANQERSLALQQQHMESAQAWRAAAEEDRRRTIEYREKFFALQEAARARADEERAKADAYRKQSMEHQQAAAARAETSIKAQRAAIRGQRLALFVVLVLFAVVVAAAMLKR